MQFKSLLSKLEKSMKNILTNRVVKGWSFSPYSEGQVSNNPLEGEIEK